MAANEDVTVQVEQPSPPTSPRFSHTGNVPQSYDDLVAGWTRSPLHGSPSLPHNDYSSVSDIPLDSSHYTAHPQPYPPHTPPMSGALLGYRDAPSPSDDGNLSASPVASSTHSSPFLVDNASEFPPPSDQESLTQQLEGSLLFGFNDFTSSSYSDNAMTGPIFAGADNGFGGGMDASFGGEDFDPSSKSSLHINTNVRAPYNQGSAGGSGSLSYGEHQGYLLPAPDVQSRPRNERHSFSEGSDNHLSAGPSTGRRLGFGARSAPASPASSLRSYGASDDEAGVSPQDVSPQDVKREQSYLSLSSPSRELAKPVVTSVAMQSAADRRRKHHPHYSCQICGNSFTTNFSLKRHVNSHTRENSYRCSVPNCPKVFRNASDCQRHQKKQH